MSLYVVPGIRISQLRSDPLRVPDPPPKSRKANAMESYVNLISNVGFPIFVSVFLLVKINPTLSRIAEVMAQILKFMEDNK